MRVIISGITGVVGRNLGIELGSNGWSVFGLSRSQTSLFESLSLDLADANEVDRVITKIPKSDVFIHCAALINSDSSLVDLIQANVIGTLNALKLAREANVKYFINISSSAVLGPILYLPVDELHESNPQSPYAFSKYFGELALAFERENFKQVSQPEITSFRIPSPVGIGMPQRSILPIMLSQAMRKNPLTISGDSGRKQNFLDIRDIANAVMGVCEITGVEPVYNIAGGRSYSNAELARLINKVTGNLHDIVDESSKYAFPNGTLNPQCWEISTELANKSFGFIPKYDLEHTLTWLVNSDASLT
ncbi:NAD-dependent epimerase/dehydratase family protein [Rheinheimera sp. MM224]|uniref:NAD-dependent epimerase/dehydratase family protein n=1 Tax=Rheinheimera sp. MM224 TaxID=3019969 RepID=UPI0021F8638F|nr:NAD(P)-dependent oxidoreductase [Rheinheimera sp. MM224]CAI3796577.1 GDP-L-fucose synthase [Rheinheimera sp. MM224]